ncbi:MAG: aminotransferase class I/II-fold pyridoxal phosphate-dependent enzyme [Lachnospiraceae bacterium]|nr:aminotransferase class I/II-fold pyridoxal phosphate-dependent enzyme [Lachnospiraceae bacterium]
MGKYDFTSIIERKGNDAIAVDAVGDPTSWGPGGPKEGFDIIPMWIADMNFKTAPSIVEAIQKRLEHPLFGYFRPRDEYFQAIIDWQSKRNGVEGLKREHIGYENGVLGGFLSALRVLVSKGEKILVHSPTYVGFTGSARSGGFAFSHSPLVKDENGVYRMDFEDMEKRIVEEKIHTAIFCSPHNPAGRVWERWEIEKAMELFEKYQVYVISDEIWSDLIMPGHKHIPTQSVSQWAREHVVALYAPSKTFSLAGLIGSYHIIYNKWLNDRICAEAATTHYNSLNVLSMYALIGAYSPVGEEWLEELIPVLANNLNVTKAFLEQYEGVVCTRVEGTYMLFVDCTKWCADHGKTIDDVLKAAWDVGVAVQDGRGFYGNCHFRMNLALPLSRVEEALERLKKYVFI